MSKPFEQARNIDCRDVLEALNIPITRRKTHYRCPVCQSKALQVFNDGNCQCHTCEKQMNAVDLVSHITGQDAGEACDWLASRFGLSAPDGREIYIAPRRSQPQQPKQMQRSESVLDVYMDIIRRGSKQHALDYLTSRGISQQTAESACMVSISESDWRHVISNTDDALLVEAGLLRERDGKLQPLLFAFPILVMPYHNDAGELSQIRFGVYGAAREIDRNRKYLSCFDTQQLTLWGVERINWRETVHITEGELNALSLRDVGAQAVSCSGSGTWRDEWCEQFEDTPRIMLWQDEDAAGSRWSDAIVDSFVLRFGEEWVSERVEIMRCPTKKDANDLLRSGLLAEMMHTGGWRDVLRRPVFEVASVFSRFMRRLERDDEFYYTHESELESYLMNSSPGWYSARMNRLIKGCGHTLLIDTYFGVGEFSTGHLDLERYDGFGKLVRLLDYAGEFTEEERVRWAI